MILQGHLQTHITIQAHEQVCSYNVSRVMRKPALHMRKL